VTELRDAGFDATRAASLRTVPTPKDRPELEPREAQRILARTVYLPVYPEMPERAMDAMAAAVARALRSATTLREKSVLTPVPASPGAFPRPRR